MTRYTVKYESGSSLYVVNYLYQSLFFMKDTDVHVSCGMCDVCHHSGWFNLKLVSHQML